MTSTFEMDPTAKAAWVEALRSDKFTQTRGTLEYNGCNCCLGVLCRINNVPTTDEDRDFDVGFKFESGVRVGFPDDGFMGLPFDVMDTLATMNDGGATFEEIATYIEENL